MALLCHGDNYDRMFEVVTCMKKQYATKGWEYIFNCYHDSSLTVRISEMMVDNEFNLIESAETQWGKFDHIIETNECDKIAFCSSDDLWTYQKTQTQLRLNRDVIISSYISQSPDRISWFEYNTPCKFRDLPFLTFCVWSGWMFDKDVRIPDILSFHEDYGIEQYILSCLLTRYDIYIILLPLFAFTVHDKQLTNELKETNASMQWMVFIDGFRNKIMQYKRCKILYVVTIHVLGYTIIDGSF